MPAVLCDQGQHDDALSESRAVLALARDLYGNKHQNTLVPLTTIATTCARLGLRDEELNALEELLDLHTHVFGATDERTLHTMCAVGIALIALEKAEAAREMYEEALPKFVEAFGEVMLPFSVCVRSVCVRSVCVYVWCITLVLYHSNSQHTHTSN